MPPAVLKTIRFLVPAAMLYCVLVGVCWYSHWCDLPIPTHYDQLTKSIAALIFGFLYSMSNLRELANQKYYKEVNQNLIVNLTTPFAHDPNVPKDVSWLIIRPIFYRFVDNDASLKHQATLAYWNGALWTSAADLRAISAIRCLLTALTMLAGNIVGNAGFDNVIV